MYQIKSSMSGILNLVFAGFLKMYQFSVIVPKGNSQDVFFDYFSGQNDVQKRLKNIVKKAGG
ncbi:MAG: hypothetical protein HQM08_24710 [Candidatus Riflebacteria bacterium]|nr:hypothetical protein [Candidatus Riflebacteria bacterium]